MCVFACPTNNEVGFESVPKMHLAIIMDGNGRWAKTRGLGRIKGHKEGAKRVEEIVRYASKIGVHTSLFTHFQQKTGKGHLQK